MTARYDIGGGRQLNTWECAALMPPRPNANGGSDVMPSCGARRPRRFTRATSRPMAAPGRCE